MRRKIFPWVCILGFVIWCGIACEKAVDPPSLGIPSQFVFERNGQSTVNYEGQTQRLDMLTEMDRYMALTRQIKGKLEQNRLLAMYANADLANFEKPYTKNLKDKTYSPDTSLFEQWIKEMASTSALSMEASPGKAGFLSETYGTQTPANDSNEGYLVNEKGIEYQQIIVKGIMGAVVYYQAMEIYLSEDRMEKLGNDEWIEGTNYTAMEHYFDEAFGYFGIPVDFPANTGGARFWGKYCYERTVGSGTGRFTYPELSQAVMDAWLKGRAAIVAKNYEIRDEAIMEIAAYWEQIAGATAADYVERAKDSRGVARYKKHHYLSEAIAFMMTLKYHFDGGNSKAPRISDTAKIQQALDVLGPETDLWSITDDELDQVVGLLIDAFPEGLLE